MFSESLLREPADRGVRLVALSLLADAEEACDMLVNASRKLRDGDAAGDDALHEFRVAVRRLRSWIRAFNPSLKDAVTVKQRRRLSEIGDATGATRDATVHLEWLRNERPAMSARQRVGQAWLSGRLTTQREDGCDAALAAATDFHAMVAKLRRRLGVYRSAVLARDRAAPFGALLAERLLTESDALRSHLAAIHQSTDVEEAHRARIAAKRLRYVTEPLSSWDGDGDAIIATLKTLQDSLGDLHDVHVFSEEVVAAAEEAAAAQARHVSEVVLEETEGDERVRRARSRDPGPGLLQIARRLHERGLRAFADIERDWLNDAGAPFFERVRALAADLRRRASLGTEVERKYLLERLPDEAVDAPSVEIQQGYLPGETLVERVRCVQSPDGTERWFRTVKFGHGIERVELEEVADADLCRVLWGLTEGRRIRKRRYSVHESGDLVWEVDEFLDRPLVVAEIELPTPHSKVDLPPWLRAVLDRDVTDEPEYTNARLAR
jgi:CHAD domain-containing protein/CYTH domain-containing protein